MRPAAILASLVLVSGCTGVDVRPCPASVGDLVVEQIGLVGSHIGESALVTSPDGTKLLIDAGDAVHADRIREVTGGAVDLLLVTHSDRDHAGGLDELADVVGAAERIEAPGTWQLGGGAELAVFLVDGILTTPDGSADLRDEVVGIDGSDNARSSAGIVRWGDFAYLFAGDLTGGGKGTPDVESAVAARGDLLLDPGDVDLLHLNHHGISSSTNRAWTDWLLPDDGASRNAVVGANRGYLDAPAEEVVDRVGPRLGAGMIHATQAGSAADADPALVEHEGSVFADVFEGGTRYEVCGEGFEATGGGGGW